MIYIHKGSVPPEFAEAKRKFNHYDGLHKIDKEFIIKATPHNLCAMLP